MSKRTNTARKPQVVVSPKVFRKLMQGSEQIVSAIRPTLGPTPCLTIVENALPIQLPELLDSGSLIARCMLQIPDRTQDIHFIHLYKVRDELYTVNFPIKKGKRNS